MLTPQQIEAKRFTVVRLRSGYDQDEVDDFMDRVIADYEYLHAYFKGTGAKPRPSYTDNLANMQETQVMSAVPPQPTEAPAQPSEMIAKILKVAEETAEKHIHEGKVSAEQIRLQAKDEAEVLIGNTQMDATNILSTARADAERVTAEAEAEKNRIVGELETKRAQLKAKVDELIRVETEVTTRMRNVLDKWSES